MILTIEPLLLAINALPKSLLIPTETRTLRWLGYRVLEKLITVKKLGWLLEGSGIQIVWMPDRFSWLKAIP
ncbi:hypothetical protein B5G52_02485 [Pseudoalteromonas sp. A601]|nr:hypothetical protein B5G52_02485 [Pseudoalteromonas sp. A601]